LVKQLTRHAKTFRYVMTVTSVIGLFLAWSLIPSNVAGRTKRTLTSSFTFVGYCVGNIIGSQIFNYKDAVSLIYLSSSPPSCQEEELLCSLYLPVLSPWLIKTCVRVYSRDTYREPSAAQYRTVSNS
jgi:hypothetical protein